jgi:hypothetical protein
MHAFRADTISDNSFDTHRVGVCVGVLRRGAVRAIHEAAERVADDEVPLGEPREALSFSSTFG